MSKEPSVHPLCLKASPGAGLLDFVTVARAADGKLMTKVHFIDSEGREQTRSYDKGYLFNFSTPPIACLDDLARVLDGLDRHSCVIYGRLIEGTVTPCRRLLNADAKTGDPAAIEDAAHHWLLLDIDKLAIGGEVFDPVAEPERAVEYILAKLPPEFHGARCLWRLTSSAGVRKNDTISMRLGFWLDRALTGAEAKAWLTGTIADCSIYTANQVIYAATPVFKGGRADPAAKRSGIVEGRVDVVPGDIAPRVVKMPAGPRPVKVPAGLKPKAKIAPRNAPEGVVFDTEAAIAVGRDVIERALASDEWKDPRKEAPTPTGARAYKLATSVKDEALSPGKIVDLLVEMVPTFDEEDRPQIEAMVESAFLRGQNDPGCGPSSTAHLGFEPLPPLNDEDEKLYAGAKCPKWGKDPRGEGDDQTQPIDIFGDVALTGKPPFPVDALPYVLADFVTDRAERLGVDPAMIAMPALVACAAVLDDRHTVQVRQHDQQFVQSARLWLAVIDEPGGKKTPAIHAAILHDLEAEWSKEDAPKFEDYKLLMLLYKQQLRKSEMSDESLLFSGVTEPQKPSRRRLVVNDTTTEALAHVLADNPSGVIGVYDELAQLWGSFDAYHGSKGPGPDRPLWLQLYDGGRRSIDRVSKEHLDVPNWGASIVGGIQPERMRQLLRNLSEDGLLQRFMLVFGSGPSLGIDRPADEEADRAYREVLQTIAAWRSLLPVRVTLSLEAHDARQRVMQRVQLLLHVPETPAALKNHLNKWEALFARLALTLHAITIANIDRLLSIGGPRRGLEFAREVSGEIGESVEKLMLDYLLPTALRFYAEFYGRPEHVKHACWVADHILAHRVPLISARDVGRAYNAVRDDPQALERAMSYLETAGWIVPMNGSNTRRPSRWWVDPRVHLLFKERAEAERNRRVREVKEIRQAQAAIREAA